jgi:heterotetrameric sarcosine oxidase gamma subunit
VVELKAKTPCSGLLPLSIGRTRLEEVAAGALTSLAVFDSDSALSAALKAAHGMALPGPNQTTESGSARCIWFGRNEALLIGPEPDASLSDHGAVVDVSDGWAAVSLLGEDAIDVLARLVPVDLREKAVPKGRTVRTLLGHMSASITRTGQDRFLILVFRSMAQTLVHDLSQAMEAVASRR